MLNSPSKIDAINDLVRAWDKRPYILGQNDCGLLVRDLLLNFGHNDPCPNLPEYQTIQQARKAIKALGYKSYTHLIDSHATMIEGGIYNTIDGDIVGVKAPNNWVSLTVRVGVSSLFGFILPTADGMPSEQGEYLCRAWDYDFLVKSDLLSGDYWRPECLK